MQYTGKGAQAAISFERNQLLCQPPGGFIASNGVWNAAKGENCYRTSRQVPRSRRDGHRHHDACRRDVPLRVPKCLETRAAPPSVSEEKGGFFHYRKADINLRLCDAGTTYSTYVATEWQLASGFNCFGARGAPAHGARDLENPPGSSAGRWTCSCQQKCSQLKDCNAVTWQGPQRRRQVLPQVRRQPQGLRSRHELRHLPARTPSAGLPTPAKTDEAVRRRGVQWALGVASGKNKRPRRAGLLLGSNPHRWANTSLRVSDITTGILQCCSASRQHFGHLLIEYPEGEIAPHVFDAYTARGLEVFVMTRRRVN